MNIKTYKENLNRIDKEIEKHQKRIDNLYSERFKYEQAFIPECEEYQLCNGNCETCIVWINA